MSGEAKKTRLYAVRVTAGQEKNVAEMIADNVLVKKVPIKAILAPETIKGYIFVESPGIAPLEEVTRGVRHIKTPRHSAEGKFIVVEFPEVERYLITKRVVEELEVGDIVEIVAGPFKGMEAKVRRVDKAKDEVTIEILEASYTLPVTVHADYVRKVRSKA